MSTKDIFLIIRNIDNNRIECNSYLQKDRESHYGCATLFVLQPEKTYSKERKHKGNNKTYSFCIFSICICTSTLWILKCIRRRKLRRDDLYNDISINTFLEFISILLSFLSFLSFRLLLKQGPCSTCTILFFCCRFQDEQKTEISAFIGFSYFIDLHDI